MEMLNPPMRGIHEALVVFNIYFLIKIIQLHTMIAVPIRIKVQNNK